MVDSFPSLLSWRVAAAPAPFVRGQFFFDLGDFRLYAFGLFGGSWVDFNYWDIKNNGTYLGLEAGKQWFTLAVTYFKSGFIATPYCFYRPSVSHHPQGAGPSLTEVLQLGCKDVKGLGELWAIYLESGFG